MDTARRRVVITGIGVVSPVGIGVEPTWRALVAGTSGGGPITHFEPSEDYPTRIACEVKGFDASGVLDAKEARRYAERMITFAKRGDLTARRQAARFIIKPVVLQKLFDAIGPRFAERPGGYTRIMRAGIRKGDDAQMAILELVDSNYKPKGKKSGKTDVSKKEADAKRKKDMKKTAAQPPA